MNANFQFVYMKYDAITEIDRQLEDLLHPEESKSIERAVFKRKREFLCGHACAKYALSRLAGSGVFDRRICIKKDCYGAPFFSTPGYSLNITHGDGGAAAIVSDTATLRAGLDMQKPSPSHTATIYHFLDTEEKKLFDGYKNNFGDDYLAAVFWVAKEAMSKLLGMGFAVMHALKINAIEQKGRDSWVTYENFPGFSARLFLCSDFLFGLAAYNRHMELIKNALPEEITLRQLDGYTINNLT